MRSIRILVISCSLLFLTACAGFGIVASSDPLTKLNDAEDLFMRQGRPLPAERLIREAMDIYQERNDPHGLGNAHREYADLLRSPAVVKWEKVYRKSGFRDTSVTFDNRFNKASEYYSKALEYYRRAEKQHKDTSRFDALTNLYFNMGWSSLMLDDRKGACAYYDSALEAYSENIKRNPGAKPQGSIPNAVSSEKQRAGCG